MTLRSGLATFDEQEARQTRAIIHAARKVVLLADASKFARPSLHKICDLSAIDCLVCDHALSEVTCTAVAELGCEVIAAPATPKGKARKYTQPDDDGTRLRGSG